MVGGLSIQRMRKGRRFLINPCLRRAVLYPAARRDLSENGRFWTPRQGLTDLARHRVAQSTVESACRNSAGILWERWALAKRDACRPTSSASDRTLEFEWYPELKNKKGSPFRGCPSCLARPERFELPTARFVVSSLTSKLL